MQTNKLNIGLFGFGCVGTGLYEVLKKTPGLSAGISKICVKDKLKRRDAEPSLFTYDKEDLLFDPDINVIVELIDDADAAFEIVRTALANGKAVVSANKKMIAEHFQELLDLQYKYNVPFLYEAACCASIPIIRNLEEYYDNDLLESISGIVNGSTNYILSKVHFESISYKEALRQAQDLGYAESNPELDTGGYDAKYKLLILLAHAFGIVVEPDEIINIGIDNIDETVLKYARSNNLKIKLVAHAFKVSDNKVTAFVLPQFIESGNELFTVDDVFNGVITKTCFADQQFFVGKGAGAYPTASAVLSDISALRYGYRYEYKKLNNSISFRNVAETYLRIFISHPQSRTKEVGRQFMMVEETYSNGEHAYTSGVISLKAIQLLVRNYEDISIILLDRKENLVQTVFLENFIADSVLEF